MKYRMYVRSEYGPAIPKVKPDTVQSVVRKELELYHLEAALCVSHIQ